MIIRTRTFTHEDNRNSFKVTFFPEKCCCIMIPVYTVVFLEVFYLKRIKEGMINNCSLNHIL